MRPLIARNNRGKLEKVPKHNNLHASKWHVNISPIDFEEFVHAIKKVCANHRNFINYKRVKRLEHLPVFGDIHPLGCNIWLEPKKGVDGLPADIYRRNPRG